jgi:hypothetical protein
VELQNDLDNMAHLKWVLLVSILGDLDLLMIILSVRSCEWIIN